MLALSDSSKSSLEKKESGHNGKRRKINDESESCPLSDIGSSVGSCGKDGEFISAEKEHPEDDTAYVIIGCLVTKNMDLRSAVPKVDSSVSAGVLAICNDQNVIIFDITKKLISHPMDLHSVLVHVSKLEKKTAEFFTFINVLPAVFHGKILEFVDTTFRLRSVLIRPFCARSVHASNVCHHAAEIVKINFEINVMVKRSASGSRDKITEICESQNEEVVKMAKLFHEKGSVDLKSVVELASSITVVNDRFLDLVEFLPKDLPSKLSHMYTASFKLYRLCLQKDGTKALTNNGSGASQELKDA